LLLLQQQNVYLVFMDIMAALAALAAFKKVLWLKSDAKRR
jgi:hypothetical protein